MWNNLFVSVFWLLFCLSYVQPFWCVCVVRLICRTHVHRGILFAVQRGGCPSPSWKENTFSPTNLSRGRVCVVPNFRPLFYLGVILSCGVCRPCWCGGGMCWSYNSVDWVLKWKSVSKSNLFDDFGGACQYVDLPLGGECCTILLFPCSMLRSWEAVFLVQKCIWIIQIWIWKECSSIKG